MGGSGAQSAVCAYALASAAKENGDRVSSAEAAFAQSVTQGVESFSGGRLGRDLGVIER